MELGGEQFLVAVPQRGRRVDHQRALLFGGTEDVGGHQELAVHRRILAHQDHVQLTQRTVPGGSKGIPALGIHVHREITGMGAGLGPGQVKVGLLHVNQLPAPLLGGPEHGERAVFLVLDVLDGVHHDTESDCHRASSHL